MGISRDILKEQLATGLDTGVTDLEKLTKDHVALAVIAFFEENVMVKPLLSIAVRNKNIKIDGLRAHATGFFKYSYGKYTYDMTLAFSADYKLYDVVELSINNDVIIDGTIKA